MLSGTNSLAGMTVNERLYVRGLLERFDAALEHSDRQGIIDCLIAVEITPEEAATTADAILSSTANT